MVALPKLQKCFGCASLRTGTLIIGALSLVSSLVGILASISFMAGILPGSMVSEIERQTEVLPKLSTNCLHI